MTTNYMAINAMPVSCAPRNSKSSPRLLNLFRKINVYYVLAGLIIIWTARITPLCIYLAAQSRGYAGYGGEYLILPLGIVVGIAIISIGRGRARRQTKPKN